MNKFAQKRHYPRDDPQDNYCLQEFSMDPILKKSKYMNSYSFPSKNFSFNERNNLPITVTLRQNSNFGLSNSFQNLRIDYMNNGYNSNYNDHYNEHFQEIKPQRCPIEEERRDRDDEKRYRFILIV